MQQIVLDASVAVKWCVLAGEPHERQALALLERQVAGEIEFLVPDLFWAEIGNLLWKAARQNRCTAEQALQSIRLLKAQELPTYPSIELMEPGFAISRRFDRSFYDSVYVALALERNATLITADEKLANAMAAYLPVKWLGAI